MDHTALALIELGAVFFLLGVLGKLAQRIGMSPIPLYLVGGLFFGDGGVIALGDIGQFTQVASEIGVVLLLLLLGLEYSATELVTGMRRSWVAGVVDLVANAVPGAAVALLLGWGADRRADTRRRHLHLLVGHRGQGAGRPGQAR